MKNLREEIEKVFKDVKIFPEGLGYGKDSNVSHWRIVKFGELEHLVRTWANEIVDLCSVDVVGEDRNTRQSVCEDMKKKIEEARK